MRPYVFECYFWLFRGVKLSCEQISSLFSSTTFYNEVFQCRLGRNDGLDSVCQNSFLRCGQANSVLCISFRSSMDLIIHLPRFLEICSYFCFAGIVVETNQEIVKKMFVFFLHDFFFCHQSSFCNRGLISCSIHRKDGLYPCEESST